ncbi:MAG: hypothetical protein ACOYJ8_00940 [Patescibacteria group bacterium]
MKRRLAFFLIISGFFFYLVFPKTTLAQHDSGVGWFKYYGKLNESTEKFEQDVFGSEQVNQASHAFANIENVIFTFNNMLIGCVTEECQEKNSTANGAIGGLSEMVGYLYVPPASSSEYLADLGKNFNVVNPVYAQTDGFQKLIFLLPAWKIFRNVSYSLMAIVFVVIGFMIIFRSKINPQTVITVQSSIPKIIMTLILITFSYAIAGLMIDLIYFITGLGISLFDPEKNINRYINMSLFEYLKNLVSLSGKESLGALGLSTVLTGALGGIIGAIASAPIWASIIIGAAVIVLIFAIILLIAIFKLFFSLLGIYVKILFLIVTAPIQILMGAIPGSEIGFKSWLKSLFSSIIVFPAVALFLVIGSAICDIENKNVWTPPLIPEGSANLLIGFLGFGMILLVAKIPDIVQSVIQKQSFDYGGAIGQGLSPAKGLVSAPINLARQGVEKGITDKIAEPVKESLTPGYKEWRQRRKSRQTETSLDEGALDDMPE